MRICPGIIHTRFYKSQPHAADFFLHENWHTVQILKSTASQFLLRIFTVLFPCRELKSAEKCACNSCRLCGVFTMDLWLNPLQICCGNIYSLWTYHYRASMQISVANAKYISRETARSFQLTAKQENGIITWLCLRLSDYLVTLQLLSLLLPFAVTLPKGIFSTLTGCMQCFPSGTCHVTQLFNFIFIFIVVAVCWHCMELQLIINELHAGLTI